MESVVGEWGSLSCFATPFLESPTYSFFFNDTATPEIHTLSLHDALPISRPYCGPCASRRSWRHSSRGAWPRSEEHTSELQSPDQLVCRLLLEKKKANTSEITEQSSSSKKRSTPHFKMYTPIKYMADCSTF